MRINYRITADDVREAQLRHSGQALRSMQVLGLVLVAAGIVNAASNAHNLVAAVPPVLIGFFLLFGWRFLVSNAYKKDGRLQHEFSAVIGEDGIEVAGGASRTEYGWSSFTRLAETKNLFLLYQAPRVFNIFPKRAFESQDAESFRTLAIQKLRPVVGRTGISARTWIRLMVAMIALVLLVMAIRKLGPE